MIRISTAPTQARGDNPRLHLQLPRPTSFAGFGDTDTVHSIRVTVNNDSLSSIGSTCFWKVKRMVHCRHYDKDIRKPTVLPRQSHQASQAPESVSKFGHAF